jgi:hypothetical protein
MKQKKQPTEYFTDKEIEPTKTTKSINELLREIAGTSTITPTLFPTFTIKPTKKPEIKGEATQKTDAVPYVMYLSGGILFVYGIISAYIKKSWL